jgi:hypothetical protein
MARGERSAELGSVEIERPGDARQDLASHELAHHRRGLLA